MRLRGRSRQGKPSVTAQRVAAHRLTFERVATSYGDPKLMCAWLATWPLGWRRQPDGCMSI